MRAALGHISARGLFGTVFFRDDHALYGVLKLQCVTVEEIEQNTPYHEDGAG
jgi:hypothetical protein